MPDLTLMNFRKEVAIQLGPTELPNPYVFVRCVGKHFTEVSHHDTVYIFFISLHKLYHKLSTFSFQSYLPAFNKIFFEIPGEAKTRVSSESQELPATLVA